MLHVRSQSMETGHVSSHFVQLSEIYKKEQAAFPYLFILNYNMDWSMTQSFSNCAKMVKNRRPKIEFCCGMLDCA